MKRYPHYKDSGVAWLGEVPQHWEVKRLKDVATYNDEQLDENTDADTEIEYVDISSVSLINGIEKTEPLTFDKAPSRARRKVRNGDVIVSTVRTYLKAIAAIKNPPTNMIVSTGFAVIRPRHDLSSDFAGYLLQSNGFVGEVVSRSVGVSYPAINASDLVKIAVATPPLPEQQTIAAWLDGKTAQIDALIRRKQTLLEKLAEKRSALISHTVTKGINLTVAMKDSGVVWLGEVPQHWELLKARYVFSFSKGLTITKENLQDEGVPCINYGEIHSKYGVEFDPAVNSLKCVSEDFLEKHPECLLDCGDFVFADTSEDFKGAGNFSFLNSSHKTFAGYHTIIGKLKKNWSAKFIAYLMDSQGFRQQIQMMIKGVKVFSITQAILKDAVLWLPPLSEQQTIAAFLDRETARMDAQRQAIEAALAKLQEYRSALISHAVTGKIDIRSLATSKEL